MRGSLLFLALLATAAHLAAAAGWQAGRAVLLARDPSPKALMTEDMPVTNLLPAYLSEFESEQMGYVTS